MPSLRQMVADYQIDSYVRFVGPGRLHPMRERHAIADIFFLPSKQEGLALAIYEAMAMYTVPVSANVGGQAELTVAGRPLCPVNMSPSVTSRL